MQEENMDLSKFGETLKKIRTERNLTQDQLAEILGTTKQNISRYEKSNRSPNIKIAAKYASILGLTLSELNGTPETENKEKSEPIQSLDDSYIKTRYEDTKLLCENYEEMPESMRLPILKMVAETRKQLESLRQNERNDDNADAKS